MRYKRKLGACRRFVALYTFLPNSRTSQDFKWPLKLIFIQSKYITLYFVLKALGGGGAVLFRYLCYLYQLTIACAEKKIE